MEKVELREIVEEEIEPELPPYEPPQVVTYHDDDLLAELGPAQACSYGGSVVGCPAPPWEEPWQPPGPSG
jgi:hypothetical protein